MLRSVSILVLLCLGLGQTPLTAQEKSSPQDLSRWDSTVKSLGVDYLWKEPEARWWAITVTVIDAALIYKTISKNRSLLEKWRHNLKLAQVSPQMAKALAELSMAETAAIVSLREIESTAKTELATLAKEVSDPALKARLEAAAATDLKPTAAAPVTTDTQVQALRAAILEVAKAETALTEDGALTQKGQPSAAVMTRYQTALTEVGKVFRGLESSEGAVGAAAQVLDAAGSRSGDFAEVEPATVSRIRNAIGYATDTEVASPSNPALRAIETAYAEAAKISVAEAERVKAALLSKGATPTARPMAELPSSEAVKSQVEFSVRRLVGVQQNVLSYLRETHENLTTTAQKFLDSRKFWNPQTSRAPGLKKLGVARFPFVSRNVWVPWRYYGRNLLLIAAVPTTVLGFSYYQDAKNTAERRSQDNQAALLAERARALQQNYAALNHEVYQSALLRVITAWKREQNKPESELNAYSLPYRLEDAAVDNPSVNELEILMGTEMYKQFEGGKSALGPADFWAKVWDNILKLHVPALANLEAKDREPILKNLAYETVHAFDKYEDPAMMGDLLPTQRAPGDFSSFFLFGKSEDYRWERYSLLALRVNKAWKKMQEPESSAIKAIASPIQLEAALASAPVAEELQKLLGKESFATLEAGRLVDEPAFLRLFEYWFKEREELKNLPEEERKKIVPLLAQAAAGALKAPEKTVPAPAPAAAEVAPVKATNE